MGKHDDFKRILRGPQSPGPPQQPPQMVIASPLNDVQFWGLMAAAMVRLPDRPRWLEWIRRLLGFRRYSAHDVVQECLRITAHAKLAAQRGELVAHVEAIQQAENAAAVARMKDFRSIPQKATVEVVPPPGSTVQPPGEGGS